MTTRIKVEVAKGEDDIETLFKQYLTICNEAIDKHKDEFPYKEILNLGNTLMGDRSIDLAIYDDRPKGAFSLKFKNQKLANDNYPSDVEKAWRVNLSYLKHVVEYPEKYIEHPEKLDLDWLKSRLGI